MCFGLSKRQNVYLEPNRPRYELKESRTSAMTPRSSDDRSRDSTENREFSEYNPSSKMPREQKFTRKEGTTFGDLANRGVIPKSALDFRGERGL